MSSANQQLTELFQQLGAADQAMLLTFAEFLVNRSPSHNISVKPPVPVKIPEPEIIERPGKESVVGALKRLSKSYPMLDKTKTLSATSDLVSVHIMKRSDAAGVIDELEKIFADQYEQLKSDSKG